MSISILPSTYYQMSNLQNGSTNTSSGGGTTAAHSPTQTLIDALNAVDNNNSGNNSQDAYSLNLSPQAQQLMNNSNGTGSNGSGTSGSSTFTLTSAQQTTIKNILAKYKDAPFTQDTFNSIQNDLEAAGLGADQMSAKDMINSFSSIGSLVNALNGNYSSPQSASSTLAGEQTKANNYMQSIISAWQAVSTTASSSASSGVTS